MITKPPDQLESLLVIGNYKPDNQQSMLRFGKLLTRTYHLHFRVTLVSPPVFFSRLLNHSSPSFKYFAYLDKLILFPIWLLIFGRSFDLYHIVDHSNAFYSFFISSRRCIITCHDLLAVRGAFGDKEACCEASALGPYLQKIILLGLRRCSAIGFDSQATYLDYRMLVQVPTKQNTSVIYLPLNNSFSNSLCSSSLPNDSEFQLPPSPYLLMVGSSLVRKNRRLALQLIDLFGKNCPYHMVFAGGSLSDQEILYKMKSPYGKFLVSIVNPSHLQLNILYCNAYALLFPSIAEGFGWPIIEAQTCGCPVISSTKTSAPEVGGLGALYADPHDVTSFAKHVSSLQDPMFRKKMVHLGYENTKRFTLTDFSKGYLDLLPTQ